MIEVEVEDAAWTEALANVGAVAERAAIAVLKISPCAAGGGDQTKSGEGGCLAPTLQSVNEPAPSTTLRAVPLPRFAREEMDITILLTDDASIQSLNARFRGKDVPTNVLSFPAPESAAPHLGDIALAYGVCAREAAAQGKSLQQHLMHLTAHGVLHLLGYDHETDAEAEVMEGMERAILNTLGVSDPYAEPGALPGPGFDETHAF